MVHSCFFVHLSAIIVVPHLWCSHLYCFWYSMIYFWHVKEHMFGENIFGSNLIYMHSYLNDLQYTVCQESFLRSSLTEALVLIVFNLNTQKQVVQRLRKEVETFKAENANGAKVSIASLLGLNNNNHITNNNETKHKTGNDFTTKSSKEDYEEIVRNGDILSPTRNPAPTKWVLSSSCRVSDSL